MERKIHYTKAQTRIETNGWRAYHVLLHNGKCVVCGDEFKYNGKDDGLKYNVAKYCSERCKNDATMLRRKEKRQKNRKMFNVCIICNTPIQQGTNGKIRKYCSNKCKQQSYRSKKTTSS
jgi:hypothetical protein